MNGKVFLNAWLFVASINLCQALSWEEILSPFLNESQLPLVKREKNEQSRIQLNAEVLRAEWDTHFMTDGSVGYQTLNQTDFLGRDVSKTIDLKVGGQKKFQHNGGVLESHLALNRQEYDYRNASVLSEMNPLLFSEYLHYSELGVSYSHPLMENRHNVVAGFSYKAEQINKRIQFWASLETVEQHLQEVGLWYLEWLFLHYQTQIHDQRLAIALQEKEQMEKRFQSSLVDRVDVLRAVDKYKEVELLYVTSKQNLQKATDFFASATGLQPSRIILSGGFYETPHDIETFEGLSAHDESLRMVKSLLARQELLSLEEESILSSDKPVLDWWISTSLYHEAEELGESMSFEDYAIRTGFTFKESLHQYDTKNRLAMIKSRSEYLKNELQRVRQEVGAKRIQHITELKQLIQLIEMDVEQKELTRDKTAEEIKMFEQGRSQYTFVLSSRDRELQVELNHLNHVYQYHLSKLLWLNASDLLVTEKS